MRVLLQVTLLCSFFLGCNIRNQQKSVKALVLLVGDYQGELFKEQKTVIAFKDSKDSIHIKKVILPNFNRPAFPGDSIEIFTSDSEIEFGKLYKYPYSIKKRYIYKIDRVSVTRKALFDNGVLVIGTFDDKYNILSMDFYTYKPIPEMGVEIYPIGYPDDVAFIMQGTLGQDSLFVRGYNELYLRQAIN